MTAGRSRDAQVGGDISVLTVFLTLLPQSFHNICCGSRAPWSEGAFPLMKAGCLRASVVAM